MPLLSSHFTVLTFHLFHVLTPQISIVFADVMRQYLLFRSLIISTPIAVKSSWCCLLLIYSNMISLLLIHNCRCLFHLLLFRHHRYRLLLLLADLLWLLLLLLLLLQVSSLPIARCRCSAILSGFLSSFLCIVLRLH